MSKTYRELEIMSNLMSKTMSNYKLTDEIKDFIIKKKLSDKMLSCRDLVPIIKDSFSVELSKSLINNIIKDAKLSSAVGRRKRFSCINTHLENGGCVFILAADEKLQLSAFFSEFLEPYFPQLPRAEQSIIHKVLLYAPIFKLLSLADMEGYRGESLWWLSGGRVSLDKIKYFFDGLNNISLPEISSKLSSQFNYDFKLNDYNMLHENIRLFLHSYVIKNFFPPVFQFFDFLAMKERFYSLSAELLNSNSDIICEFSYSRDFFWLNDVLWKEGFKYAAAAVTAAKIILPGEKILIVNSDPKQI